MRLFIVVLLVAACGGPAPERACVPGRAVACVCPGGAHGTQSCVPDGSGFDACSCGPSPGAGRFTDVPPGAGVLYHQSAPSDGSNGCLLPSFCELNLITGSAAAGDYDADGRPDLFVTTLDATPILFRNRGDGTFADVTAAAGLAHHASTNGAAWLDADDDGDLDLMVTTVGADRYYFYLNDGHGHFSEDAVARGLAFDDGNVKMASSIAVGDYDRDGWLDLYLAEWGFKGPAPFQDPKRPAHNRLMHNRGPSAPGHFDDVSEAAGVLLDVKKKDGSYDSVYMFGAALVDLDGDDWPDLALSGDLGTSHLFWNDQGSFHEGTKAAGVGLDHFGMGSAIADFDRDGRLDWLVTSVSFASLPPQANGADCVPFCDGTETGNHFYLGQGKRAFADRAVALGVAAGSWGWGAALFDADLDGDLDLVETNGIDYPFLQPKEAAFFQNDAMRFWRNDAGVMVESAAAAGLADARQGRALVTFDYDGDGDLDVFVVDNAATPVLYRNDGPHGDWLAVRVLTASGREAVGARVTVRPRPGDPPLVALIGAGSHFQSQAPNVAHFGLGAAGPPVDVTVRWPDTGKEKTLAAVKRNALITVKP